MELHEEERGRLLALKWVVGSPATEMLHAVSPWRAPVHVIEAWEDRLKSSSHKLSRSYMHGRGPGLEGFAHLMTLWCSEGDVATSANLNRYDRKGSSVNWHSDDESLSGGGGFDEF